MMGRHQYITEDEYEVNLKDFEPQPGNDRCLFAAQVVTRFSDELWPRSRLKGGKKKKSGKMGTFTAVVLCNGVTLRSSQIAGISSATSRTSEPSSAHIMQSVVILF